MAVNKGKTVEPLDDKTRVGDGDVVHWLVFQERVDDAHAWLRERGWEPATG